MLKSCQTQILAALSTARPKINELSKMKTLLKSLIELPYNSFKSSKNFYSLAMSLKQLLTPD